jgi:predicted GIY-YIG superfamily endonuclease
MNINYGIKLLSCSLLLYASYTSYNKNWYQYTQKQIDEKYYVGITKKINNKFNQLISENDAKWTKKYKPIDIQEINYIGNYNNAKIAETLKYYEYKNMHGNDNVRGTNYISSIDKMIFV